MDRKVRLLTLRETTGIALLLLLLLSGLLSGWYMGRQHRELSRQLEDCSWLALSGQMTKARDQAEDARQQWESSWHVRAAFGDHTPMEEVDGLFAELRIYGAAGEKTEFARVCAALAARVNAVGDAHRLSWWNVL